MKTLTEKLEHKIKCMELHKKNKCSSPYWTMRDEARGFAQACQQLKQLTVKLSRESGCMECTDTTKIARACEDVVEKAKREGIL